MDPSRAFIPYARVLRACTHCRREKSRCDEQRPCSSCKNKGRAQTCIDGCEGCRQKKLACDGNRPCSPCTKNGTKCLPPRRPIHSGPRRIRLHHIVPPRPPAILPRPSSFSQPSSVSFQPPDKICYSCKNEGVTCDGELPCSRCSKGGTRCIFPPVPGPKLRCASCRQRNIKCERARPCQHCLDSNTECIDKTRKGKGQGLRVKRACAGCRADKVQCDVDRPCQRCQKKGIQCVLPCKACGGGVPGCLLCEDPSGDTHHHCEESQAEAPASPCLQDIDPPTSPSLLLSSESPVSPYSCRSPHNYTAVCAADTDSHESSSQAHEPPTLGPSSSPIVLSHPYPSQLPPTSPHGHATVVVHISVPAFDTRERSYSVDYEESPESPESPVPPFPPNSLQLHTAASLSRRTARIAEPHSHLRDYDERPASPASRHSSHTTWTSELRSYPDDCERRPVLLASSHPSERRHMMTWTPDLCSYSVAHESASDTSTLAMRSYLYDEAFPSMSPFSSYPPQTHPIVSSFRSMASSAGSPRHPVHDTFHFDGVGAASQPLQRSLSFPINPTRPAHEPSRTTLPSFAETFPEFVRPLLSNPRVGGRVTPYFY